jgi:hypothetical protein
MQTHSTLQDNSIANMFYLALGINLGAEVCGMNGWLVCDLALGWLWFGLWNGMVLVADH